VVRKFTVVLLILLLAVLFTTNLIGCSSSETGDCTVNATAWNHAKFHVGEDIRIYGPVVGIYSISDESGNSTILGMGIEYPSPRPDAFIVVITAQYRDNFPASLEEHYLNKTICISGLIEVFEGAAQIGITSPDQIKIK
jgi:hypothetical protein